MGVTWDQSSYFSDGTSRNISIDAPSNPTGIKPWDIHDICMEYPHQMVGLISSSSITSHHCDQIGSAAFLGGHPASVCYFYPPNVQGKQSNNHDYNVLVHLLIWRFPKMGVAANPPCHFRSFHINIYKQSSYWGSLLLGNFHLCRSFKQ